MWGIAVDSVGNLYASDQINNVVNKIAPDNTLTLFAQGFARPYGLAVDT